MLKTNCREVRNKLRKWLTDCYNDLDCENYCDYVENADFKYISKFILSNFISEYLGRNTEQIAKTLRFCGGNYQRAFHQWCSGLPSTIDTAEYYYNGSALDFLADLLEENEYEKLKYTDEMKAEKLIDDLLYLELTKACNIQEAISFTINERNYW